MIIKVLDSNTLGDDLDLSVITTLGECVVYDKTPAEKVRERILDAEVIILNKVKLNSENLCCAKDLKLICVTATGFDNIDIEFCRENNIAVCNVCGYSTQSVTQLTVSSVLSLVMHLPEYDKFVKDRSYTESGVQNYLKPMFHEISSMTWGVVGYGNIGKKVAEVARALGARVVVYKKTPVRDAECVDIDTLFQMSDIITVHLPLNEETKGIINKKRLGMMKKTAVLVNMARGAVIDEREAAACIKEGRIAGFATDVYSKEPMDANSPFVDVLGSPNTIFTPHMAWGAYEARERCIQEVRENILAFFNGEIRNRVDL